MSKVFTASSPREVIEEMNRRLKKANLSQVNNNIDKPIRKACKFKQYRLYDSLRFLISKREIKYYTMQEFICFQKVKGTSYYKETEFNPNFAAILVDERGTIYRYLPNYSNKNRR